MPVIDYRLPESGNIVYRMIMSKVLDDIKTIMQLPLDIDTYLKSDDDEVFKQHRSALDDKDKLPNFGNTDKFSVEFERQFLSDWRYVNSYNRINTPVIYLDNEIGASAKPIYRFVQTTISITARFATWSEARHWLRTEENRLASRKNNFYHELEYSYPIPPHMLYLFNEIWSRRENWKIPENREPLKEYFARCLTRRAGVVTNQAGKNDAVVIKERMTRALGTPLYSDDDIQRPDPNGGNGTYNATIRYMLEHDCIDGISFAFPVVVHNNLMPLELIKKTMEDNPQPWDRIEVKPKWMNALYRAGETDTQMNFPGVTKEFITSPTWDNFTPGYRSSNVSIVYTGLLLFDMHPEDPTFVINLKDLGDWEFDADTLAYMKDAYPHLTHLGADVLHISIYQNADPYWGNTVYVDKNLNVRLDHAPDLRATYHLVFSIFFDFDLLSAAAKERIRTHFKFAEKIISVLYRGDEPLDLRPIPNDNPPAPQLITDEDGNPVLDEEGRLIYADQSTLDSDLAVHNGDFTNAITRIADQRYLWDRNPGEVRCSVGIYQIEILRKKPGDK